MKVLTKYNVGQTVYMVIFSSSLCREYVANRTVNRIVIDDDGLFYEMSGLPKMKEEELFLTEDDAVDTLPGHLGTI